VFETYDLSTSLPLTAVTVNPPTAATYSTSVGDLDFTNIASLNFQAEVMPEPSSLLLLLTGVLGLAGLLRFGRSPVRDDGPEPVPEQAQAGRALLLPAMAAILMLFCAPQASADILPDVSATVTACAGPLEPCDGLQITVPPGTLPISVFDQDDGSEDNPGSASASAQATGGLDPAILASVSAAGETTTDPYRVGGFLASTTAELTYSFEIDGPGTGTIPVEVVGNNSLSQNIYNANNTIQILTILTVTDDGSHEGTTGLGTDGGPFDPC
jgi:hypothetical protein